jgi:hypothetical protein
VRTLLYVMLVSVIGAGSLTSLGQSRDEMPSAPDSSSRPDLTLKAYASADPGFHAPAPAGTGMVATPRYAARPRTADLKFFLWNGAHLGMALFDVEMTERCINDHRCREANPAMPSSQAGQIGIDLAIVAFDSGASYWLKKHRSKVWWLPPAAGIAVHSVGVATGFEHQ